MAKTLNEQNRLWMPHDPDDPAQFGNGAPMHAAIPFDLTRALNNLQTYCEPAFQLVFDSSYNSGTGGTSGALRLLYLRQTFAYPSAGTAMLCQLPIIVQPQAKRLCVNYAIHRHGPNETALQVDVTAIDFYLAAGPCNNLLDTIVPNASPVEYGRLFDPSYISKPYTNLHNASLPAAFASAANVYSTKVADTSWTYWASPDNIVNRAVYPMAYLIMTATFANCDISESIVMAELSFWFQHE